MISPTLDEHTITAWGAHPGFTPILCLRRNHGEGGEAEEVERRTKRKISSEEHSRGWRGRL